MKSTSHISHSPAFHISGARLLGAYALAVSIGLIGIAAFSFSPTRKLLSKIITLA